MSDWEITLVEQTDSVDDLRRRKYFCQHELDTLQTNGIKECDMTLKFQTALTFSVLTHYYYCSRLVSTIILCALIILLITLIVIINVISIITTTIILFYLLISLKFIIYLFIYLIIHLLIHGPIRPELNPFGGFFNPGVLRVERVTQHLNLYLSPLNTTQS